MGKLDWSRDYKRFEFSSEGVFVVVPTAEIRMGVRKRGLEWTRQMWESMQEYESGRMVINFEVFDLKDPDNYLTEFEVPIELWVRFTAEDLKRAKAAEQELRLLFWDGEQWVTMTEEKHGFKLLPEGGSEYEGFGFARLESWGDPQVMWAP